MDKQFFTVGCCGLDCGLCPRFYTQGSSRCPGCCGEDFEQKHPSCSFITCCVKKRDLEVCGECSDFPCPKFDRETGAVDSFVTHRRVMQNQYFIKESGIAAFIEQQKRQMGILRTMLERYDEGRSKSLYCLAATLLSLGSLDESLTEADKVVEEQAVEKEDIKNRSKILREILDRHAVEENQELKLRRG